MQTVVISEPGAFAVAHRPVPVPGPGEVLVRVAACGICGTDLHTLAGSNPLARYPCVPGHEFAGWVEQTGPGVTVPAAGTPVSVDPSRSCGTCRDCKRGRPNLCPDKGGYGSRRPGGFAEFAVVEATACEPLPPGMDPVIGALAEPVACVLHAMDRLGSPLGDDVLIYGAGPIGVIAAKLLARCGASSLSMVDRSQQRLSILPAAISSRATSADDLPGSQWDIVVDATGSPAAIADGLRRVRAGGRFLQLGVAPQEATVPFSPFDVYRRELTIIGSMALAGTFARAVALLGEKSLCWPQLISHRLPLNEFADAVQLVRAARGGKAVITPRM